MSNSTGRGPGSNQWEDKPPLAPRDADADAVPSGAVATADPFDDVPADAIAMDADGLNRWVEFDMPFSVHDGQRVSVAKGTYGPTVMIDGDDGEVIDGDGWEFVDGYSGQYSYSGPVMHKSEYLGGGMARDVLDEPGTYVVTVVEDMDDRDNPAGWALLRKVDDD